LCIQVNKMAESKWTCSVAITNRLISQYLSYEIYCDIKRKDYSTEIKDLKCNNIAEAINTIEEWCTANDTKKKSG